jgi:beta-lactamase superfamily II metal-dependent hydrolase
MEIKFLSVGCGDAIHIRFAGDDGKFHNILIDGGVEKGDIYPQTLHAEIKAIVEKKEIIDLWVITHIDDDHVGGILRFINDEGLKKQIDLTGTQFWFNHSNWDFDTGLKKNNLKSVKQGIRLRDYLAENAILGQTITDELAPFGFFGMRISILSPSAAGFKKLMSKWEKEGAKIVKKEISSRKLAKKNDYETMIEDFDLGDFIEDDSVENGSSIAFLLSYKDKNFLLPSDSHPSVISHALRKLGYSEGEGKKLALELMQAAHHGSKFNISNELLQLISCRHFIFSADGINKHNLPNKETMARIIKNIADRPIRFFITHKNDQTGSIFDVDQGLDEVFVEVPAKGANGLIFNF